MLLRNAKQLEGHSLHAKDGEIGKVTDFYFDDRYWHVRYCVVSTGPWLSGRSVLISPVVMGDYDPTGKTIPVDLTVEQVRHSPDVATNKPPSRLHEEQLLRYYGWPGYWNGAMGPYGVIAPLPLSGAPLNAAESPPANVDRPLRTDPFLRSANDTIGYDVAALDGKIGHVEDLLIDDQDWRIRYLVVDTRNWWPGKKVIVEPEWIQSVSWSDASVAVDLSRAMIRSCPPYEPTMEWTEENAAQLRHHYGRVETHPHV